MDPAMVSKQLVLVFQASKAINAEPCVVSVYNDDSYQLAISYTKFEDTFLFVAELILPWNTVGRYQWIIDRLDLVQDDVDSPFTLILAPEPSFVSKEVPRSGLELDSELFDTEVARRKFLDSLNSKRELEGLESDQILLRLDWLQRDRILVPETVVSLTEQELQQGSTVSYAPAKFSAAKPQRKGTNLSALNFKPNVRESVGYFSEESRLPFQAESMRILEEIKKFQKNFEIPISKKIPTKCSKETNKVDQSSIAMKRNVHIAHRRKVADRTFAFKLMECRIHTALAVKQRSCRLVDARRRILDQRTIKFKDKNIRKKNSGKLNAKRERNIALKLETRKYVKEAEKMQKSEPHKTKTVPESKDIDIRILKLENECKPRLARGKMEHFKCLQWKDSEKARIALINTRIEARTKENMQKTIAKKFESARRNAMFETAQKLREQNWIAKEKERNIRIVAKARGYVSLCTSLIPHLPL